MDILSPSFSNRTIHLAVSDDELSSRRTAMEAKALEINKSLESAPGFGSGSSVSIEQNRRRTNSYDEDFAIKKQMKMA